MAAARSTISASTSPKRCCGGGGGCGGGRGDPAFPPGHASPRIADYAVASGIFNVAQDEPRPDWERFIAASLDDLHRTTRRGFAVNFMKQPAGTPARRGLYTTDIASWARYCTARFDAIAEVHDG